MTTLVLLHAFPLDSSMYDEIRSPLADACDLLTPDFPGFGSSPLPDDPPSLDVLARAVVDDLDRRGLGQVVIGGTSMGGYVTMACLRNHPQRFSGVVLIDTKAGADTDAAAAGRRAMADRLDRENTADALVEAVYPKLLGVTTVAEREAVAERVRTQVRGAPPRAAAWAQRAMAVRPDSFPTLLVTALPSLVVVGEEDQLSPPDDAEAMAAALAGAVLTRVPRAGHLTPLESPEAVVEAVTGFLQRLR
ncbi:MAG: alpha/beta hydrolase [Actinomycetes bacterium]